jgi:hypothetical protein
MARVYFQGTRSQAKRLARRLVLMLTGREADSFYIARGVFMAFGLAALMDIKADFVTKARGGTGEDGAKWAPLKPGTIANRRVGPGDIKSDPAIKEREKIRKAAYKKHLARMLLSLPEGEAKKRAAQLAGREATQKTGKTKIDTLGGRSVEILRDTGVLLNSLSPGEMTDPGPSAVYSPPRGDGGSEQVFSLFENGVMVGTNVLYAATHQNGDAARGIPARPFLPTGEVPEAWEQRWMDVGLQALEVGARMLYEAA